MTTASTPPFTASDDARSESQPIEVSQVELSRLDLPERFQKVLRKLAATLGPPRTVGELLAIEPKRFSEFKAVGRVYEKLLKELQREIPSIAAATFQSNAVIAVESAMRESGMNDSSNLSLREVEESLIRSFEQLLIDVDDRMRTIALARWSYTVPMQRLENLGEQFGVSRERIRQIETKFNKRILQSIRIEPESLRRILSRHMEEELSELFPDLANLFSNARLFYRFLELCAELPAGEIQAVQHFRRNRAERKVLDDFWREMPSPAAPELVIAELMNECGYSKSQAQQALNRFIELEMLVDTPAGLVPRKLTQKAAVAHALIPHEKGLPWVDIACLASQFSEWPLHKDRLSSAIVMCESSYLCGRGCYRHLCYFPHSEEDAPRVLAMVRERIIAQGKSSANLPDLHRALIGGLDCDYFGLRHFVSVYGEEHGLFFDGTSSNDTVSLTPEVERVRNREVILKLLRESSSGLTMAEVASHLKTKSIPLARLYVHRLIDEGNVVRVDEMMYSTPENAFRQLDLEVVGRAMDGVIAEDGLPVEVDVLRERVNLQLGFHHSKHLYLAIGRILAERYGWHRKRTVFSRAPIPYKGCMELVRTVCDPSVSNEVNVERLRQHLRLTHHTALLTLRWLRSARRAISEFE